jgi:hypothetical protein
MPLYRKAVKFNPEELKNMTFDECYELLLIFRYLAFREDHSLSEGFIKSSMEQLQKRMLELNPGTSQYPGTS